MTKSTYYRPGTTHQRRSGVCNRDKQSPLPGANSITSRASHLSVPASFTSGVVCLQNPSLTLVRLGEGVSPLLAHTLNVSHFADCLLKLFHPVQEVRLDEGLILD